MQFNQPSRVLVRGGYTESSVWRKTLQNEPLHAFVVIGENLDAPEIMPAGSMKKEKDVCFQSYSFRD